MMVVPLCITPLPVIILVSMLQNFSFVTDGKKLVLVTDDFFES
jgi:hypothetical protein